jgi:hypothetical protein
LIATALVDSSTTAGPKEALGGPASQPKALPPLTHVQNLPSILAADCSADARRIAQSSDQRQHVKMKRRALG